MAFAAVLQRRMLLAYLGVMLALYVSAVLTSAGMPSARGELGSVALCVTGLALTVPSPLRPRRYAPAAACMCAAPIVAMVFHDLGAAQVWPLIPLMFAAVFVRVWHRTAIARLVAGLTATAAVVALWLSPAAVPWPKAVNDSAGHAAGDRALTRAWATRLPALGDHGQARRRRVRRRARRIRRDARSWVGR